MEPLSLPALSSQDHAKLPFGLLEKWAFSADRDKLLESGETPQSGGESKEDESASGVSGGALMPGSETHIFYSLRHLSTKLEKMESRGEAKSDTYASVVKRIEEIIEDVETSRVLLLFQ